MLSNFFYYHKLGTAGFIGYSGAHNETETAPLFKEACSYFGQVVTFFFF